MKKYLTALFLFAFITLSACAVQPAAIPPPAPTQSPTQAPPTATKAARAVPSATATAAPTAASRATSAAPITRQEINAMFESVETFTSMIDRLGGLTGEEKAELKTYITQELALQKEFTDTCIGLLSEEERAALDKMEMGSPLYQQGNKKLEDPMENDPACSSVHQAQDAVNKQDVELVVKVKMLLVPFMDP